MTLLATYERRLTSGLRVLQHAQLRLERNVLRALLYRNASQHGKMRYFQAARKALRAVDELFGDVGEECAGAKGVATADEAERSWLTVIAQVQARLEEHARAQRDQPVAGKRRRSDTDGNAEGQLGQQRWLLQEVLLPGDRALQQFRRWVQRVLRWLRLAAQQIWRHLITRANFMALGVALVAACSRLHAIWMRVRQEWGEARRLGRTLRRNAAVLARSAPGGENAPLRRRRPRLGRGVTGEDLGEPIPKAVSNAPPPSIYDLTDQLRACAHVDVPPPTAQLHLGMDVGEHVPRAPDTEFGKRPASATAHASSASPASSADSIDAIFAAAEAQWRGGHPS